MVYLLANPHPAHYIPIWPVFVAVFVDEMLVNIHGLILLLRGGKAPPEGE
jgi:hypothetical protein